MEDLVHCVQGDARQCLKGYGQISFCFLDAEKPVYLDCYELVVPRMVKGGLLIADNADSHKEALESFMERVQSDKRVGFRDRCGRAGGDGLQKGLTSGGFGSMKTRLFPHCEAILFDFGGTLDSDGEHWLDPFYELYERQDSTFRRPK